MKEQVRTQKEALVTEIKDRFEQSASAVVVEYRGLHVGDMTDLRRQLFEAGVEFKVLKNTMARRAVEGSEIEALTESLTGPNAIAFSKDAVAPSRILANFAKKNKQLIIKQGVVEGKVVGLETIKELSTLPDRDGMLAMFIGALQSPIRDFAWAMKQLAEKEEAGHASEAAAPQEEPVTEPVGEDKETPAEQPEEKTEE